MMNLEDVISAFVSIIEDIIQDRKARLGRNAHLDENDCVVTRWICLEWCRTDTYRNTWSFNHPDTEAQDHNGLAERYIGL